MILNTREFNEVCKAISLAIDKATAANLELVTKGNILFLNVTNREYYCSCKLPISSEETFRTVVDAKSFLDLVTALTTETFEMKIEMNSIVIKAGKSNYKLPMIFENDKLMELPVIALENKTVEMQISKNILTSILNINSKEVQKANKLVDAKELQKLYYITDDGCFTFTTTACVNKFKLEKPVKMLLNDRIVKLFKLFNTDVNFALGHDADVLGNLQTKVVFETESIYLAALIINDDKLVNKIQGPYNATQNLIDFSYNYKFVVRTAALSAAISRLANFAKNNVADINTFDIPAKVSITQTDLVITDSLKNQEYVQIENNAEVAQLDISINLADLQLAINSCTEDHVTISCGSQDALVVCHGTAYNLLLTKSE